MRRGEGDKRDGGGGGGREERCKWEEVEVEREKWGKEK